MANTCELKRYPCSVECGDNGCTEDCLIDPPLSSYEKTDMVLNLESKSETFISDQTPTPIRLIQKCEEIGLFQDLQSVNPFEETFRKAAENIRSGSTSLEVPRLTASDNVDDSLHTPHIIFPSEGETNTKKRALSPRVDLSIPIIQSDSDSLCIPLESDDSNKTVVQQEADTSGETQVPDINVSAKDGESPSGTIQFLLRMPNGKMVQLSSLPVEEMDSTPKTKDIPIIKVDPSFLKTVSKASLNDGSTSSSGVSTQTNSAISGGSVNIDVGGGDKMKLDRVSSINVFDRSSTSIKVTDRDKTEQLSKMSLAKLKLKQALMKNTCPASSGTASNSSETTVSNSDSLSQSIFVRRPSSTSDEGGNRDDLSHDVSSAEEKRRRNRAAAMRCREKRKTWVKELERRANEMLRTNGQLQYEVTLLRDEVAQLKTLLLAHRDCPVTQALVEGKAVLPSSLGSTFSLSGSTSGQNVKRSANKLQKLSPSDNEKGVVGNSVKPLILLNDPPVKRKRLSSSAPSGGTASSTAAAVSVVTSSPSPSVVHTLVVPPKSASVLNPNFVNVIPSVLVANPTTSNSGSISVPSQVIYSHLLPCVSSLAFKPSQMSQKQPYILPKSSSNIVSPEQVVSVRQTRAEVKLSNSRANLLLSTNVIKVNPNVMDRDDSDIEILDVRP